MGIVTPGKNKIVYCYDKTFLTYLISSLFYFKFHSQVLETIVYNIYYLNTSHNMMSAKTKLKIIYAV